MKKLSYLLFLILLSSCNGEKKSIQEKLGYSKDSKLLIIHADDFGMCHSENMATIKGMEDGLVNSASAMVPCPWFHEAAAYSKNNPKADIGLHLTLTNEWGKYHWGTVADKTEVPSLLNTEGHMHEECADVSKHAKIDEVEIELRAQIEKSIELGLNPTHFDSHMGCLFWDREDIFNVYIKLGKEYNVPILLNEGFFSYMTEGEYYAEKFLKYLNDEELVVAKEVMMDPGERTREGIFKYYDNELTSLEPGLNVMLLHLGYNNEELRGITARAKNRQWDLEYFTSEKCKILLKENNIKLVTWREVRQVM